MFEPLRLTVVPESAWLVPGGRVTLSLSVHNAGSIVDRYRVAVSGVPDDWYDLDRTAVSLFPGTGEQVQLTVHPPAGSATPAGSHPFTVQATSEDDPRIQAAVVVALTVGAVGGVSMDVLPAEAEGREATYRIMFVNHTNAGVTVELGAHDTEDGLRFCVQPDGAVIVPAGGQAALLVRVSPRVRETIGQPHPYEIAFRGLQPGTEDALDPTLVRPARFTYLPPFTALSLPRWLRRLPLLALLLVLLLLLLVLFFTGYGAAKATSTQPAVPVPITTVTHVPAATATLAPTPTTTVAPSPTATRLVLPPQIKRFDVQMGPPGSVELIWAVTGASQVLLNDHPVPATGTGTLHLATLTTLVMSATNESGARTQIVQVAPKPINVSLPRTALALPVIHFDARIDPRTHQLALMWRVTQVTATTLNDEPVPWAGTREIALSGSGPTTYALRATNALGMVTESIVLPKQPSPVVQYIHLPSIYFRLVHPPGQRYTLVWQVQNAAYAALNGRHVPTQGSLELHAPVHSKTYQLEASNSAGGVTAQVRVVVRSVTSSPMLFVLTLPRILAFAVRRGKGQQVVTWRVQDAVHVWLQGKLVPATGEQALRDGVPAVHLVAANDVGSKQRSVPVTWPTPTATAPPTASPTAKPSATGIPRPTYTPTPAATHTPTPTPAATHTPVPTPAATHTPTPTPRPTPTPILEPTVMPTPTAPPILEPTVGPGPTPSGVTAAWEAAGDRASRDRPPAAHGTVAGVATMADAVMQALPVMHVTGAGSHATTLRQGLCGVGAPAPVPAGPVPAQAPVPFQHAAAGSCRADAHGPLRKT